MKRLCLGLVMCIALLWMGGALYRTQMFELMPKLLSGEMTADQFVRQSQAEMDAALEEYR